MDIISLPIEYNKDKIDSRYRLVVIASQRARELALGAPLRINLVEQNKEQKDKKHFENKVTSLGLMEVLQDKIEYFTGAKAIEAREKAEKIDYKKLVDAKRRNLQDLWELEKELKVYLYEKESSKDDIENVFGDTDNFESEE
ncbi:MAG TPA: DNA-directed RNA polymerase subunit omega [Nitrospirae bacterium]|nr:DNA-directed RNA polymerase subunit omega [Nitrospirota bacterium]